jgi:hypothetical protein
MAKAEVRRSKGKGRVAQSLIIGGYKGILAWGLIVKQHAETVTAPVKTAHLATSIQVGEPEHSPPMKFHIAVGVDEKLVPYARAQEMGSGLYAEFGERKKITIWAGALNPGGSKSLNPKKALSFVWPSGPKDHPAFQKTGPHAGKFVFGKIEHPGVKPKRYLRRAMKDTKVAGKRAFLESVKAELTS